MQDSTHFKTLILNTIKHAILMGSPLTPTRIAYYMRRARRSKAWFKLTTMQRALLMAAAKARVDAYQGSRIREALADVIARIEAETTNGALLALGLKYALERGFVKASLEAVVSKLGYIRYLGRLVLATMNYYVKPL